MRLLPNLMVIMNSWLTMKCFFFKYFQCNLDQHINSIDCVVRVQLAQRRIRNNDDNDRGGFNNNRGSYFIFVYDFEIRLALTKLNHI